MVKKRKRSIKKVKLSKTGLNFIVLSLILTIAQVGYLFFRSKTDPKLEVKEAIDKAVAGIPDEYQREMARVRAAIQLFQVKNKKLPVKLNQLVPDYLNSIPVNPKTKSDFIYVVQSSGKHFALHGTKEETESANSDASFNERRELLEQLGDTPDIDLIQVSFTYNPQYKRDPFMPFDDSKPIRKGATPLERFSLNQLKLSSVLETNDGKTALIETSDGKGYTVKLGSRIGNNGGEVAEIFADRIVVVETMVDFTGKEKRELKELRLRAKSDESDDENDNIPESDEFGF
jgi:Tfp pilus assembly protein PilP